MTKKFTIKDGIVFSYDKDQDDLYEERVSKKGHSPLEEKDAMLIANPPASSDELSEIARFKRNSLLRECDWTQAEDSPVDKAKWAEYRQKLRDITESSGFPRDISWPIIPI